MGILFGENIVMNKREHWQQVYQTKSATDVSWFQSSANLSFTLIEQSCQKGTPIIDIGGGASCLVEQLVDSHYSNLSVLDISQQALDIAKQNLLKYANSNSLNSVIWYCSDLLTFNFEADSFGLWHDRAVFHFLTEDAEQFTYLKQLNKALRVGGFAVISTFDIGGPTQCSGIPIKQYCWHTLSERLGAAFELISHHQETHRTPFDTDQAFNYCLFKKVK